MGGEYKTPRHASGRWVELELIQSHMAKKPVLRGEVGCACVAREVIVQRGGMGERGCARQGSEYKVYKTYLRKWIFVFFFVLRAPKSQITDCP